ncbi:Leucine Rich repeats (2 copies) [Polystyrenella longa]|uniref:Leucine Rich repeats (2 copies) n=1 Tax=Polystyrenella longa TaxID=2528007 RepID=A0A518CIT4_9PLAN|nr:hypothetical protein [Polystyrenella longa]QDU79142.1 Leucine Rich repeats (2 copies) [Polystyrenella longa]
MKRILNRHILWSSLIILSIIAGGIIRIKHHEIAQSDFRELNPDVSLHRELVAPDWLIKTIPEGTLRWLGYEKITEIRVPNDAKFIKVYELFDLGNVRFAHLANSEVTDDSMPYITEMSELKSLYLDGAEVTDAAIPYIAQLDELEELSLCATKITGVGLSLFKEGHTPQKITIDERFELHETWKSLTQLPPLALIDPSGGFGADATLTDEDLELIQTPLLMKYLPCKELVVSDSGMSHLRNLPNLIGLTLRSSTKGAITDAGMKNLKNHTWLTSMSLKEVNLSDAGMKVFDTLPALQYFELSNPVHAEKLTAEGWNHLRKCQELNNLRLEGVRLDSGEFESLSRIPLLNRIWLKNCTLTENTLASLSQFQGLETLQFDNMELSDLQLQKVINCPTLKTLSLWKCDFNESELLALRNHKSLETLQLKGGTVSPELLQTLSTIPRLSRIALINCELDREGIQYLGQMKKCLHLALEGSNIEDDDLDFLTGIPTLQDLNLSQTAVTNAGMKSITKHPHLQSLSLAGTKITDEGVMVLADAGISFLHLDLAGTRITDESMSLMPQLTMRGMYKLNLADTAITDAGIKSFVSTPTNETYVRLTFSGTQITAASIEDLNSLDFRVLEIQNTRINSEDAGEISRQKGVRMDGTMIRQVKY